MVNREDTLYELANRGDRIALLQHANETGSFHPATDIGARVADELEKEGVLTSKLAGEPPFRKAYFPPKTD